MPCRITQSHEVYLSDRVPDNPGRPLPQNLPQIAWLQNQSVPGPRATPSGHLPQIASVVIDQLLRACRLAFKSEPNGWLIEI